jgi:hypothetical protein
MVAELRERGSGFQSRHEALDTTTPGGRLIFHVFAALAEFRELIVAGTHEGLAAARAFGRVGGRPTVLNGDLIRAAATCCPTRGTASRPSPASAWSSVRNSTGMRRSQPPAATDRGSLAEGPQEADHPC